MQYNQIMRIKKLNKLKDHAMYGKLIKKLKRSEVDLLVSIINNNEHLNKAEFSKLASRYFINKPKPKNYLIIIELLDVVSGA